ncbi:hypothetical protein EUTSA_v10023360mg [Eutrema salsugineum]|uniref:Protein kinase domain-containing protein n=1 Tax=Eutrema salsugineum TaxID=72664 RepID=V4KPC6_EUTSA|nr:hypothetical protein EUTSA_v10023360mg [Eutrema salsugineum]
MTSRQLLFVLLGVFAITQLVISEDQEGFISLDCGLSADEPPYTDSSNKLRFSSDAKFVEGGKSGTIQKHLEADYLKAYTTLRYFPDGIRNCYNLNVTQDTRYLVRASFVYGNYNGLDSHPIFDLYIGRSWWATISNDLEDPNNKWTSLQSLERGYGMSEEIIHTAIFNTLQVCLVKTDATVPFISALELRPLSDNVYATRNGSLKRFARVYFSNTNSSIRLRGNPNLYNISSSKKKFPVAVVASVASIVICLVVLVVLYIGLRRKWSSREALRPSIETAKRRFTYSEVMGMTNNFQKILGEGGFGIIYHGHLDDIQQVAVKVLSQSSSQGYKQFKAEVELLMRVHHINLVNLAGYCDERDHLALVYEYMENRDLKEHLSEGSSILDWPCRLRIAAEAALGLEYLHTGCKPPMIHRDVKSTNILLNEDFQAKLGDFGLSRSFPVGSETHVSTVVVGTPGFLDPEYFQTHRLSEKSDVYSFGIVLLEVITNQLVIDQTRERPHIAEWVRYMLSTGDIESIMDPNLKGSYESSSAWKALELAMSCCIPSSAERPNMAQIVHELNECLMYENSKRGKSQDVSSKTPTEVSTSTQMAPMAR